MGVNRQSSKDGERETITDGEESHAERKKLDGGVGGATRKVAVKRNENRETRISPEAGTSPEGRQN